MCKDYKGRLLFFSGFNCFKGGIIVIKIVIRIMTDNNFLYVRKIEHKFSAVFVSKLACTFSNAFYMKE